MNRSIRVMLAKPGFERHWIFPSMGVELRARHFREPRVGSWVDHQDRAQESTSDKPSVRLPGLQARLKPGRMPASDTSNTIGPDIVLWRPAWFGVKPELVLKGGFAAWAPLGEGNATVERAEPTRYRPDWGGSGRAAASVSLTFVSERVVANRVTRERLATTGRALVPVRSTRGLTRSNLIRNQATAAIEIDPVEGRVTLAGRPLAVEPVSELPLNRRYFLR